MNLDIPPLASTLIILSSSWNNFSTSCMKNLTKQFGEVYPLGIQISPTLGISPFSSILETTTIRDVGSEKRTYTKIVQLCSTL